MVNETSQKAKGEWYFRMKPSWVWLTSRHKCTKHKVNDNFPIKKYFALNVLSQLQTKHALITFTWVTCFWLIRCIKVVWTLWDSTFTSSVYDVTWFLGREERLGSTSSLVFNFSLGRRFCTEKEGTLNRNQVLVVYRLKPDQN
jgi:hypothetical protein